MNLIAQAAQREGGALWHLIEDFLDWLGPLGRMTLAVLIVALIAFAAIKFFQPKS